MENIEEPGYHQFYITGMRYGWMVNIPNIKVVPERPTHGYFLKKNNTLKLSVHLQLTLDAKT